MVYSNEEIELTLNFYSIAKVHLDNLNQALHFKELNDHEKNEYMFYSHIVSKVNYWLKELLPDELEIISLRNFENKTFDLISIHVGYANHSSIVSKYNSIINKVRKLNNEQVY